jgi:hypothetical protein
MTATILPFPPRGPFTVDIEREDEGGWLVTCRRHGWLHGSADQALEDARAIAAGFNVAVRVKQAPMAKPAVSF